MPKSVEQIAKALKLKAEPAKNGLSVRVGTKKYVLPFDVRIIVSDDYLFVHVPPSAGLMKITSDGLKSVTKVDEAENAVATFRQTRKRGSKAAAPAKVEVPEELKAALKKIPAGYKLAYGPTGPRMVRSRNRAKKAK